MKVLYRDKKTGKKREIPERDAKILKALGRGTYETRDMARLVPQKPLQASAAALLGEDNSDLDALDQAGLHALAASLGVKLHPQTGAVKVRAAIIEHRKQND